MSIGMILISEIGEKSKGVHQRLKDPKAHSDLKRASHKAGRHSTRNLSFSYHNRDQYQV